MKILKKKTSATSNIFRAVITDLKLRAADRHFETLISFLACCCVDVGAISHSHKNFNDTLLSRENRQRKNQCLVKPSSTLDPTATSDMGHGGATNQAILGVAPDETGVPCPIPVTSPGVYSELERASYDVLAEFLIKSIQTIFQKRCFQGYSKSI